MENTESEYELFEGKVEMTLYQERLDIYKNYDVIFEDEGEWYQKQNKQELDFHCKPWEIAQYLKGDKPFTVKHIACSNPPEGITLDKYFDIVTKMNMASRCAIYIAVQEKVFQETEIDKNNNTHFNKACEYYEVKISENETRNWDQLSTDLMIDFLTESIYSTEEVLIKQ